MSLKKCLLSSRIVPQIKGSSVLNNHINRPCRAMSSNRVHGQGYSCACMLCTNINQYAQGLSKVRTPFEPLPYQSFLIVSDHIGYYPDVFVIDISEDRLPVSVLSCIEKRSKSSSIESKWITAPSKCYQQRGHDFQANFHLLKG